MKSMLPLVTPCETHEDGRQLRAARVCTESRRMATSTSRAKYYEESSMDLTVTAENLVLLVAQGVSPSVDDNVSVVLMRVCLKLDVF